MNDVLAKPARVRRIIINELNEVAKKYAQPRRSEILYDLPEDYFSDCINLLFCFVISHILHLRYQFIRCVDFVKNTLIELMIAFILIHNHASFNFSFSMFRALISRDCTPLSEILRISAISLHV